MCHGQQLKSYKNKFFCSKWKHLKKPPRAANCFAEIIKSPTPATFYMYLFNTASAFLSAFDKIHLSIMSKAIPNLYCFGFFLTERSLRSSSSLAGLFKQNRYLGIKYQIETVSSFNNIIYNGNLSICLSYISHRTFITFHPSIIRFQ